MPIFEVPRESEIIGLNELEKDIKIIRMRLVYQMEIQFPISMVNSKTMRLSSTTDPRHNFFLGDTHDVKAGAIYFIVKDCLSELKSVLRSEVIKLILRTQPPLESDSNTGLKRSRYSSDSSDADLGISQQSPNVLLKSKYGNIVEPQRHGHCIV